MLKAKALNTFPKGYRPEIDISEELGPKEASYYQYLIGIVRLMVELGRVDIFTEVSMMLSHIALPRKGHLEAVFHMFVYLKIHHNSEMVFDPSEPEIDMADFLREDWSLGVHYTMIYIDAHCIKAHVSPVTNSYILSSHVIAANYCYQ